MESKLHIIAHEAAASFSFPNTFTPNAIQEKLAFIHAGRNTTTGMRPVKSTRENTSPSSVSAVECQPPAAMSTWNMHAGSL